MDVVFAVASDIIFYFFCGAVAGILFIVCINIVILVLLAFGFRDRAKHLENFLDKVAWPLRLGGNV